jgi:hypothetical protein
MKKWGTHQAFWMRSYVVVKVLAFLIGKKQYKWNIQDLTTFPGIKQQLNFGME